MHGKQLRLYLTMGFFTALLILFANLGFAAGAPVQITTNSANQGRPDVHGNIIVWKDIRAGNWDIYMYNLGGGGEQVVANTTAYQNVPATNGMMVVWQDDRNGSQDVFMRDVFLGIEQPLVTGAGNQGMPEISGNTVVYVDDHAGNNDIYSIDLATRTTQPAQPVCTNSASQWQPRVSGSRVVWEDNRNGNWDIYMMDIVPDTTPPTISAQSPADGQHTGCISPVLSAGFSDNRVGVDSHTAHLTLDGQDVTSDATITGNSISYQPGTLAIGQHSATLSVADLSGNIANSSWQFYTSSLELGLNTLKAYWENYADYNNRELSVPFQLLNVSTDTPAWSVEILTSTATAGVILTTPPVEISDISPGAHNDFVLKYLVPPNTASFKTTVFASVSDSCGVTSFFPGPPPGE